MPVKSRSLRHRAGSIIAGLVIGAPLAGAVILGAVLAGPDPASAATTQVTFSGTPLLGLDTLACPSTPSVSSLAVRPGTVVDFINQTGRTATLWAGDSQKSLPDKSLVPVTFTKGPASVVVQMLPACSLDLGSHAKMTVTVAAPGTSPSPAPPVSAPPPGASPSPSQAVPASPSPGHGATAVAPIGVPTPPTPAGDPTTAPASDATVNDTTGDNDPFAAPTTSDIASDVVVGTPTSATTSHGASGLLTLIATVGVVGVSAAAIRAAIAQRAIRALAA